MAVSKKKLIIYLIIPVALNMSLILAYFSGVPWLHHVVIPVIPWMHPNSARELGLLENLQNVFLLTIIVVAAFGIKRKKLRIEKAAFAGIFLFSLFVLLEEMDYGLHYYEYARGVTYLEAALIRNVHNISGATKLIKRFVDFGMALLFVVMPLAFAKSPKPLMRYVTPDRFAVLTMIAMVCMSKFAHFLKDIGAGGLGSITKNISEFRELSIYYIFLIYLACIVFFRIYAKEQPIPAKDGEQNSGQGGSLEAP